MKTHEGMMYDPTPSGWQYGFPKEYKPYPAETIEETLKRDGYPVEEYPYFRVRWFEKSN
jgi:hypothetical protein